MDKKNNVSLILSIKIESRFLDFTNSLNLIPILSINLEF